MRLQFESNKRPFKLGKLYCLWYDKNDKPRIVIGPDYLFSIAELLLANLIMSGVSLKPCLDAGEFNLFKIGLALLIF
jgi:hypothetical protein